MVEVDFLIYRKTVFECINLKRIVLPNNIEAIEFGAFEGCKKLETVEIPSVRKIIQLKTLS